MGLVSNVNGTALTDLLTYFIKQRTQKDFGAPATKKAEEIQKAKQRAFMDGCSAGLAGIVNDRRREMYKQLPKVAERGYLIPVIYEADAFVWLRTFGDEWELGTYKDMSDEDLWKSVEESINVKLVHDEQFDKAYEADRRRCILAGELDPSDDDVEWLTEEVEQFKSITAPAEAALAKLLKS